MVGSSLRSVNLALDPCEFYFSAVVRASSLLQSLFLDRSLPRLSPLPPSYLTTSHIISNTANVIRKMVDIKVGILTVSDTAYADASSDRSGPLIREILSNAGYSTVSSGICRDERNYISNFVKELSDESKCDLIITTGGTGFGRRDVTPEAIEPLIHRKTPALTQAITANSLRKTPLAALSRGVTGIRTIKNEDGKVQREVLIVSLPGSPKAVKECLEVLLEGGVLKHALELLQGGTGEAKHKEMQGGMHRQAQTQSSAPARDLSTATDTGCAHHYHHHNHGGGGGLHSHSAPKPRTTPADHDGFRTIDPTTGPSLRHRISPYPLIELDQALRMIAEYTPAASATETVPVGTALIGHVLAEDVCATSDLPPGPTTNVDGYAVNSSLTPAGEYTVKTLKTLSNAGSDGTLKAGEIFRINTGQGLPAGTDAVVMVEDTELISANESNGEELTVRVLAQVDAGENVRPKGSDVQANQVVLRKGTTITALGGEIGTLAFLEDVAFRSTATQDRYSKHGKRAA